jgi:hypothetical protein
VIFPQDTVEVRVASNNKRFYPTWSQFLDDAAAIFGERLPGGSGAGIGLDGAGKEGAAKANGADQSDAPPAEPTPEQVEKERQAQEAIAAAEAAAIEPIEETPATPEELLKRLKREVKLLKRAIKVVGMQREEWEREALSARGQLEQARDDIKTMTQNKTASQGSDRYRSLRQVIVRKLHPDAPGTPEEKRVREQIFKTIWKEVEHLDRQ